MDHNVYQDQILSGELEVEKVLETENFIAYPHPQPHWQVHIVIVPKIQIDSLLTLNDNDLIIEMTKAVRVVATMVKEKHGEAHVHTHVSKLSSAKRLHWYIHQGEKLN